MASMCGSNLLKLAVFSEKGVENVEAETVFRDRRSSRSEQVRIRLQTDDVDDIFGSTLQKQPQSAEKHSIIVRARAAAVAERTLTLNATRQCELVKVRMKLDHQIQFGEHHAVVGSNESFGAWKERVMMGWTEAGWVVDVEARPGEKIEFKYITLTGSGNVVWEDGANRSLIVPDDCCNHYQINSHWCKTNEKLDLEVLRHFAETECIAFPPEEEERHSEGSSHSPVRLQKGEPEIRIPIKAEGKASFARMGEPLNETVGKSGTNGLKEEGGDSLTKPNERLSDRMRKQNINGLDRPAKYIVHGDRRSPSWWLKLDLVRNLLTGDLGKTERLESLVSSAIYLTWIQSGHIHCSKGDGVQPKKKLGDISRYIFRELERILSVKLVSPKEVIMVRKVHRLLPIFGTELTESESLKRIQCLVKCDDVPHEIKADFDHFIKSQLFWASGPENLGTAEAIQLRINKFPAEQKKDIAEQFKVFYAELREFYNASSLEDKLGTLLRSFDEQKKAVLEQFLHSKQVFQATIQARNENSVECAEPLVQTLHDLTELRAVLAKGLESGLRNDAPNEAIAMRQKWRLADAGLEDSASSSLSRYAAILQSNGGAKRLADQARPANFSFWNQPLRALVLGICQIRLSGWDQRECLAIENEILAWQAAGITPYQGLQNDTKTWCQRLEATLERSHRLLEAYSAAMRELYSTQAEKQGAALGMSKRTVRTCFDAEHQSSVVSTLSSILSILLTAARDLSGSAEWDTIMPGEAIGTLVEVDRIVPDNTPNSIPSDVSVILLVKEANGDEEVGCPNVSGMILQQQLSHSSHLGMTATREGVVFTTLTNDERIENLRPLIGKQVRLCAAAGEATVSLLDRAVESDRRLANTSQTGQAVRDVHGRTSSAIPPAASQLVAAEEHASRRKDVLDLESAISVRDAGLKAASCRELLLLANELEKRHLAQGEDNASAAYKLPKSQVIPAGAFEAALAAAGVKEEYEALLGRTETAEGAGELEEICKQLTALVSSLGPETSVMELLISAFGQGARLILRPTTNVGSLAENSNPRLSKQVLKLSTSDLNAFGQAIAEIWASLHTTKQMLRRRGDGFRGGKVVTAAILVQELLVPNLSFVLRTVSPVASNSDVMQAEIAPGLGKVLRSGTRGTPWRLALHKSTGEAETLAFANFSRELTFGRGRASDGRVISQIVDYSLKPLSFDPTLRASLGKRLVAIGRAIEERFGSAQDIEGCVVGNDIYILETRSQL